MGGESKKGVCVCVREREREREESFGAESHIGVTRTFRKPQPGQGTKEEIRLWQSGSRGIV